MEISNWSVQDWAAAIGTIIAVGGVIFGALKGIGKLILWIKRKYKPKAANIRANFFKQGKSWRIRVYNASEIDIHAENIQVIIPETEGVYARWDDSKTFPRLKNMEALILTFFYAQVRQISCPLLSNGLKARKNLV